MNDLPTRECDPLQIKRCGQLKLNHIPRFSGLTFDVVHVISEFGRGVGRRIDAAGKVHRIEVFRKRPLARDLGAHEVLVGEHQRRDGACDVGDPQARAIGERLFLNNCAQCHGSDGRGAKGFPNLTDADWLYGNAPEQIVETITKGRNGVMPALGAAVGGAAEVEQLAQYVLSLSGSATDPVKAELGKGRFAVCAACHGPEGKGNQALGAPNLSDKIWLHGGGLQSVVSMINGGKDNMMPAWNTKLTEGQIHVLASYVLGLSQRAPASASK